MTFISVVLCARNEEAYLPTVLASVFNQSVKPSEVIVVDDGSTDNTFNVASQMGCRVVRLPFHKDSFVGRPELATRFNVGLTLVSMWEVDYVLILGADSVLPCNYLESLLAKVKADKLLKIVSGCVCGEVFDSFQPRGSGRLIDAEWWFRLNGLRFPVVWGWEAWLQYKALSMGFKTECTSDLKFNVLRKSCISQKQVECHGVSMNVLGYFWLYAFGRCVSRGPKFGLCMLRGYVKGRKLKRLDVAGYVYSLQRKRFISKVACFFKRGFVW